MAAGGKIEIEDHESIKTSNIHLDNLSALPWTEMNQTFSEADW